MAQLVGLGDVAKLLGIESRVVKRPGNRLWELIRARRIDLPYVRIGRLYRFDDAWSGLSLGQAADFNL